MWQKVAVHNSAACIPPAVSAFANRPATAENSCFPAIPPTAAPIANGVEIDRSICDSCRTIDLPTDQHVMPRTVHPDRKLIFCHLHNAERIQCRFDNHASAHTAYFADDTSTERYQKTNTLHLITPLVLRRLAICRTGSCPRFSAPADNDPPCTTVGGVLFDLIAISFICNAVFALLRIAFQVVKIPRTASHPAYSRDI